MSAADTTTTTEKPPHILIFPFPAQGHTLPLLDLTNQLSLRHFTITIVTTPNNLPTLSPLLSAHSRIHSLTLPLPPHPALPSGVENVKDLGHAGNLPIIVALSKLYDPILQWFRSHPNPPVALISDFFLGWTLRLADDMNIPRFVFFTSGAFAVAILDFLWNRVESVKKLEVVDFVELPRSPSFKMDHLSTLFRRYRDSDPDWELVREGMLANAKSYGCVFNSFEALECDYFNFFKRQMGHGRVYGVGPVSLLGPYESRRGNPDLDSGSSAHVFDWLDGCPEGSVLYVCFGSQKLLSKRQMEALASGLEKSNVPFIWVVKTGTTREQEEVPDGFEERVAGRGVVIKGFAPQAKLLSHGGVGGFLSHCGWNSVLEGIASGVMILGWPMEADQFVNERLLVEELGVAVRVCMGGDTVPDADELGKVIGESMRRVGCEQEGKRDKVGELKRIALASVREGGSSRRDLGFVWIVGLDWFEK